MRQRIGLVSVIFVGVIILAVVAVSRLRPAPAPELELTQAQIEQRAHQVIQDNYPGVVIETTTRRVAWKELYGEQSCSPLVNLLSLGLVAAKRDSYNPCNPNTLVWVVELQGTFRTSDGTSAYYQVVLAANGEFIAANSGPITPSPS